MNETRDVLMRTKRLLTSGHWTQHSMRRYDHETKAPSFCLVGGLRETSRYNNGYATADYLAACYALAETTLGLDPESLGRGTVEHVLICFNDRTGRTVDEVVDLIDRAVEKVTA